MKDNKANLVLKKAELKSKVGSIVKTKYGECGFDIGTEGEVFENPENEDWVRVVLRTGQTVDVKLINFFKNMFEVVNEPKDRELLVAVNEFKAVQKLINAYEECSEAGLDFLIPKGIFEKAAELRDKISK